MVVALGALHPHAEEELRDVLDLFLRILHPLVPGHRRARDHGASRPDEFADERVVGLVGKEAVAYPSVEGKIGEEIAAIVTAVLQQCRPFVRKEIGVFSGLQQVLDEQLPLVRRGTGQERRCFLGGWQGARNVERDAAEKDAIVTLVRGANAEGCQILKDQIIDEVAGLGHRRRWPGGHSERRHTHQALIPHHHCRSARQVLHPHGAIGSHIGTSGIVRLVDRLPRDVAAATVAEPRRYPQVRRGTDRQSRGCRLDSERHEVGVVCGWRRGSLFDPASDRLVIGRRRIDPAAAPMGHAGRGL